MNQKRFQFVLDGLVVTMLLIVLWFAALAVTSVNDQQSQNCSPKTYSGSQEQSEPQLDFLERTVSDPISLFTFFLVVVASGQLGLFWWQLNLIRDSVKDTNIAAIAAQRSADTAERALTILERPFVYCDVSDAGIVTATPTRDRRGIDRNNMQLSVYNFGRTPARITRFYFQVSLELSGPPCRKIDPSIEGGNELPVGTVCANGDPFVHLEDMRTYFPGEENAINSGEKIVWVCGFVRYDDIFSAHYINGFALKFDIKRQRFVRSGGAEYNYERKEEEGDIPLFPTSIA